MVKTYVPKKGDLVILSFDPSAGHEQQGRRPALVVSNEVFNEHVGLALVCPITNTDRKFPFHVQVQSDKLTGYIMTEQIKSIDYKVRDMKYVEKASAKVMDKVLGIIQSVVF